VKGPVGSCVPKEKRKLFGNARRKGEGSNNRLSLLKREEKSGKQNPRENEKMSREKTQKNKRRGLRKERNIGGEVDSLSGSKESESEDGWVTRLSRSAGGRRETRGKWRAARG